MSDIHRGEPSAGSGGPPPLERRPLYERIYAVVRLIPRGQVATYGQIAEIVGGCTARMVGYAMAAAPEDVPWQRVVNAQGKVSPRADHWGAELQRQRLIEEGIEFDAEYRMDLARVRWPGPSREWLLEHGYPPPEARGLPPENFQPGLFEST
ncbi:MGMT family protein [Caldilinea sp.]|uniref:MGMT family protein n=1 Tax=Caldilinea sp. TaxID=2293560 RepID=UPI00262EFC9A|nr:MGMT family protein [uncultured Caldilinea sp.]